jgi:thioredoxin reductase (NADPH)
VTTSEQSGGPKDGIERVVIVGSGPAGWTAAIYAARANLDPICLVGVPKSDPAPVLPGGQLMLTTEVENYPGFPDGVTGPEMMAAFQKQAERFGTRIAHEDVVACDFSSQPFTLRTSDEREIRTRSVIIATGAVANWLGLPNEMRLARSGGGVSACAVCDGALPAFRNQPLAVVGGGDTAMEEAAYLAKFGSKVHIIHRRGELRASKTMLLEDVRSGEQRRLPVAGLFIAIGHSPATGFLAGSGVEFDDKGYVLLRHRDSRTNIEGVFAGGDVADPNYRQAVTAAGMGCQAAIDCERWLAAQGVH